jgi:hypothetical protein
VDGGLQGWLLLPFLRTMGHCKVLRGSPRRKLCLRSGDIKSPCHKDNKEVRVRGGSGLGEVVAQEHRFEGLPKRRSLESLVLVPDEGKP